MGLSKKLILTLEEELEIKRKRKEMREKIISAAIGIGLLLDLFTCCIKSVKANKNIKPLKQDFVWVVKNEPYKTIPVDEEYMNAKLDYGGKIDMIIKERNKYVNKIGGAFCFPWHVFNDRQYETGPIIVFNPFAKVPTYTPSQQYKNKIKSLKK